MVGVLSDFIERRYRLTKQGLEGYNKPSSTLHALFIDNSFESLLYMVGENGASLHELDHFIEKPLIVLVNKIDSEIALGNVEEIKKDGK